MTQIAIQEFGVDELLRRLDAIGDSGRYRAVRTRALRAGIRVVERNTKNLLVGQRSGRIYRYGNVEHQASAPGEPPAVDTGNLKNSIGVIEVDADHAVLGATANYAGDLEYGTRRIAARPFMRPGLNNSIQEIGEVITRVVDEALDGR